MQTLTEWEDRLKFLDLFAGIGGFRLGMEAAGHECIGFCEIDKFARKSYKAIHNTEGEIELHDITRVTDEFIRGIGSVDVICGGFPCQAFSIAGNRRGFEEDGEPMFTLTSQDRHGIVVAGKLPGNHDQNSRVYNPRGLAPTLSTMQGGGQEPKIIQKARGFNKGGQHSIAPTLSSNSYQENNLVKVVDFYNKITKNEVGTLTSSGGGSTVRAGSFGITDGYRIRKLTPRECWRLQGFPDWAFDKAQEVNSNSQLYKQAGNSVTVNVIAEIAKRL